MLRDTDYIQQLADYIKKNLSKGYTIESLKWALINQGYPRSSIEKAINIANQQLAESAPKMKEKPVIKYEVIKMEKEALKKSKVPKIQKSFWKKLRLRKKRREDG